MICTKCGAQCENGQRFCAKCGAPLENVYTAGDQNYQNQQQSNYQNQQQTNYQNQQPSNFRSQQNSKLNIVGIIGSALYVIATLLPYEKILVELGVTQSKNLYDGGDAYFLLVFGILGLLFCFLKRPTAFTGVSILATFFAVFELYYMENAIKDSELYISLGIGAYLFIIAGIIMLLSALVENAKNKEKWKM